MSRETNLRESRRFHTFSVIASLLVIFIGASAMAGWIFDLPTLKSVVPGLADMKFNTAASLVMAGASLLLFVMGSTHSWSRQISRVCAFAVLVVGLLTLGEYLFHKSFGIDDLLCHQLAATEEAIPNPCRMSDVAALDLLVLGAALLTLNPRRSPILSQWLAALAGVVAILALIGYIYDFKLLYAITPYTTIALHAAVAFLFLSAGILAARADSGIVAHAIQDYAAIGLGASLAILLVIGTGTYRVTRQFIRANEWVMHTLEVDEAIGDMYSNIQEIQSGERSYIATGDDSFLASHNLAVSRTKGTLGKLNKLLVNNPRQRDRLARLSEIVAKRIAWTDELIAIRREEGHDAAVAKMAAAGPQIWSSARVELTGIHNEQNALLEQRIADVKDCARLTVLGLGTGIVVSVIILVVVFSLLSRENIERRKTEDRFKGLLESAPDASVIVNDRGAIVLVNSQTEKAFGYTREELLGQKIELLLPAGYPGKPPVSGAKDAAAPALPPMAAGLELYGLRKDGTRFPVEISLSPLETDEGSIVIGSIRDVTERKRLQEERDLFFNLSLDLLCIAGFDGQFKRVNLAWTNTLGFTSEELTSQPFLEFVHPEDRPMTVAKSQEISEGGRAIGFENRYRCKDGSYRWLSWSAVASPDLQRTFAVARDVTAQKLREQEIHQLNKDLQARTSQLEDANEELEAFSYSVSHDLRAPLRAIDGFSQMLEVDCQDKLGGADREHLQRIRAATQRMALLIDNLLALSKITRAEMRRGPVDLSAVAESIVTELRRGEPERRVVCHILPGLKADGDVVLLHAALENLLGNAWKFTSKQPSATIEFGQQSGNGGSPVYFVRDNGAGFDMTYAQKLFEAFQRLHNTTDFEGTGIGLATVQRIIHRHGGRVWAEGAVNQGATFYFTLS